MTEVPLSSFDRRNNREDKDLGLVDIIKYLWCRMISVDAMVLLTKQQCLNNDLVKGQIDLANA